MEAADYLWLRPSVTITRNGDELILRDHDHGLRLDHVGRSAEDLAKLLDGSHQVAEVCTNPLMTFLLPVLERHDWLVRLSQPITAIPEILSRQLAYYCELTRKQPDVAFQQLAQRTVLIVGAGGIGSHVSYALAAAGVRHLIVTDGDRVDGTNLNRQFLYALQDVGLPKVEVLRQELIRRFPAVDVVGSVVDFDIAVDQPVPLADITLLCAEVNDFYRRPARLGHERMVLQAGYFGAQAVVGPLVGGTTELCWPCYVERYAHASSSACNEVIARATAWNSSGTTVNAVAGGLAAEVVIRYLAPVLGGPPLARVRTTFDLAGLQIQSSEVERCQCECRRVITPGPFAGERLPSGHPILPEG